MTNLNELTQEELINIIEEQKIEIENLKNKSMIGRKQQVFELLKLKPISIQNIAEQLKISKKNVSSQLTYLRSDGIKIYTDNNGFKFIPEDLE